jgi:hypothetical protein
MDNMLESWTHTCMRGVWKVMRLLTLPIIWGFWGLGTFSK